jgi:hypothetical protein
MAARLKFPEDESELVLHRIETVLKEEDTKLRHQKSNDLIEGRTLELEKKSRITELSLLNHSLYKGFIHPETRIWANLEYDPLLINDDYIYQLLIEKLHLFKNHHHWKGVHIREIVSAALMMTLDFYFGNNWLMDTERHREEYYKFHTMTIGEPIDLKEFKHRNIASCTEKASVVQNLFTFLGYSSLMFFSSHCILDSDTHEAHAYNLICTHDGRFKLFDPTNPIIIYNEKNEFFSILPAFYDLSDTEVHNLKNGGVVEVRHQNYYQTQTGYLQKELKYRTYSG